MKYKTLGLAAVSIALFGCVSVVPIDSYQSYELPKSGVATQAENSRFRVIITGIENKHGNKMAGDLAASAYGSLQKIILDAGAKQVSVDRELRDKLETEFQIIDATGGESQYSSPEAANLALKGEITSAILPPARLYISDNPDDKDGRNQNQEPSCTYTAQVGGTIAAFEVNPVRDIGTIQLSGSKTFYTSAKGSRCPDLSAEQSANLFMEALGVAIASEDDKLKGMMASSGFVRYAKRDQASGKMFYELSIPPKAGAVPGVKVKFVEEEQREGYVDEILLGEGEILCTHKKDRVAWAGLTTPGSEERILQGTKVVLSFKANPWMSMLKGTPMDLSALQIPGMSCNP